MCAELWHKKNFLLWKLAKISLGSTGLDQPWPIHKTEDVGCLLWSPWLCEKKGRPEQYRFLWEGANVYWLQIQEQVDGGHQSPETWRDSWLGFAVNTLACPRSCANEPPVEASRFKVGWRGHVSNAKCKADMAGCGLEAKERTADLI